MLIPQCCRVAPILLSRCWNQEKRPPGSAASSGDVSGSSPALVSGVNSRLLYVSLHFWDPVIQQWEGEWSWLGSETPPAGALRPEHGHSKGTLQDRPVHSPAPAPLLKSLLSPSRVFAACSVSLKRGSVLCSPAVASAQCGDWRSACPWPDMPVPKTGGRGSDVAGLEKGSKWAKVGQDKPNPSRGQPREMQVLTSCTTPGLFLGSG